VSRRSRPSSARARRRTPPESTAPARARVAPSPLWTVGVVALVYVATLALLPDRAVWINDNGNKYLQVRAILASGYTDYALRWPGHDVDPTYAFNPLPGQFSHVVDGKLYSQYSPTFAAVSAPFFQAFGFTGLRLLPLLCSILALVGVERLADGVGVRPICRHAAVAIAGLGTPLWFYATLFWEHALVVCTTVWAAHATMRVLRDGADRPALAAGFLAGMGVWFREDAALTAALVGLVVLVGTRERRIRATALTGISMAAALAMLLGFQWWALGTPFGLHAPGLFHGLADHLATRWQVFSTLLVAFDPSTGLSLLLAAPFVAAFFAHPRLPRPTFETVVPLAAGFAALAGAIALRGYFDGRSPTSQVLATNSFFPAAPILLLGCLRPADARDEVARLRWWLWAICAGYAALYALVAPPLAVVSALHWGGRFFLVLYPLLAVLTAATLDEWRAAPRRAPIWQSLAVAAAALVGLVAQGVSIDLLSRKLDYSAHLQRVLEARTEPVIATDVWWAPQEMFSRFPTTPIFYVRSQRDLPRLFAHLGPEIDRVLFVSRTGPADAVRVDDRGFAYFSLALWPIPVTRAGGG
jgi:hypothetical protein